MVAQHPWRHPQCGIIAVGRSVEFYKWNAATSVPVLYAGRYELLGYSALIHERLMETRGERSALAEMTPGDPGYVAWTAAANVVVLIKWSLLTQFRIKGRVEVWRRNQPAPDTNFRLAGSVIRLAMSSITASMIYCVLVSC